MTEDYRDLHVLAGGTPRVEKLHGRDHIVVPVVALMEGVIHAINADTPEFVSTGVLSSAAHTFNGRPLVLGHPVQNGRQISANSPGVVERQGFGTIYESKTNGSRLGMEAWIDPQRLEALNQQDLLARVRAGKPIEVSVGAYVKTNGRAGLHNGRRFANEWAEVQGDHLAFLPNGRGACSLEMGCGACRMAEEHPLLHVLNGRPEAISDAAVIVDAVDSEGVARWLEENPDKVLRTLDELDVLVEQFRTLIGSRNNAADRRRIQDMHDACVELGAECGHYKLRENADIRTATIKNEGGKYVLYTRDGSRKLGTHDTRAEAEAQEKAIEAAKRRRSAELAGDAGVEEHACSCKGKH